MYRVVPGQYKTFRVSPKIEEAKLNSFGSRAHTSIKVPGQRTFISKFFERKS